MLEILLGVVTDIQPGRLAESLIFLGVLLWKAMPHLKKIENEVGGVRGEVAGLRADVGKEFAKGEAKFKEHEERLVVLETKSKENVE